MSEDGLKEIVVISGKGGTGKTSVAASLAFLADRPVIADCDVDAADMHLLLAPRIRKRHEFYSGREAVIQEDRCTGCGGCASVCRFGAVRPFSAKAVLDDGSSALSTCQDCDYCVRSCPVRNEAVIRELRGTSGENPPPVFSIDPLGCEGCGVCVHACPSQAIRFPERLCGEWMVSDTRCGPLVHARLAAAAENSGKLVSTVRREARRVAEAEGRNVIIVDGPPGIGCPVIATVTGATSVLVVTEPSVAGEHDLGRVLSLTRHFSLPTAVCVNKWDLNPGMTERIEEKARTEGASIAGRIRYDRGVTRAQVKAKTVVETRAPSAEDILNVWKGLSNITKRNIWRGQNHEAS